MFEFDLLIIYRDIDCSQSPIYSYIFVLLSNIDTYFSGLTVICAFVIVLNFEKTQCLRFNQIIFHLDTNKCIFFSPVKTIEFLLTMTVARGMMTGSTVYDSFTLFYNILSLATPSKYLWYFIISIIQRPAVLTEERLLYISANKKVLIVNGFPTCNFIMRFLPGYPLKRMSVRCRNQIDIIWYITQLRVRGHNHKFFI
ncbi:hypothetical protein QTP88_012355 [Uroleucon formosanum]